MPIKSHEEAQKKHPDWPTPEERDFLSFREKEKPTSRGSSSIFLPRLKMDSSLAQGYCTYCIATSPHNSN